ncbi:GntR family transcriptional regulator [Philodulcilactobacillus myokoensis]|uniref:GntR family transcriptional regulator n=1 Tax=Philodulcilactobacillus myokoensis TaxID=2929573 RepID=A0A9W6B288_9LACO|nr:GntR family transcriptional regulator [Philodulcilactobacillus myokoensis]GLB47532.1 GntR family transcriptional regulator [Philodulcilactobacillus myokoensis]
MEQKSRQKNIDLGTETIKKITNYIKSNRLSVGDKLPNEQELMDDLNVGRSTIREAMHVLEYSGIVDIRQGSGTYVKGFKIIDENNPILWKTKKMLEKEAITELIDQDIQPNDWLILKSYLTRRNQLLNQGKFKGFIESDILFHTKIIKMSGNPYLIKWYQELSPLWKSRLNQLIVKKEHYSGKSDYHNQLFDALVDRNLHKALKMIKLVGR